MWESLGPYFFGAGATLLLVGFFMLVSAAFRYHIAWGLGTLLVLPAPFFVVKHFRKAVGAVLVMFFGVAVAVAPLVINKFNLFPVEEKPIEKTVENVTEVDGKKVVRKEPTLTVTGLKDFDYATLKDKPYLEVLQMANEDVTDQTLENLKGLNSLHELDLSNTQVTDDGLKVLSELPKLEILKLNGTKVTDEGVRQHIFPLDGLNELSLQRTSVTKQTRLDWKAAKAGRKVAPLF
jgi:hypothetical protein